MAPRAPASHFPSSRHLFWFVGLLFLVVLVVLFQPEESNPTPELAGQSEEAPAIEKPDLAELDASQLPDLRGDGPLWVYLKYLGEQEGGRAVLPDLPGRLAGSVFGPDRIALAGASLEIVGGPQDGLRTLTDAKGRYYFSALIPGMHFFRIMSPDGSSYLRMQRVLSRGQSKRDFHFGNSLNIGLSLKNDEGQALVGARVSMDERQFVSGEDGVAWLSGVSAGSRVLVDVEGDGLVPVRFELNILPIGAQEPIELPMIPKGASVIGEVKSWPLGDRPRVTVVPRSSRIGAFRVVWERWQDLEVGPDGIFKLDGLPTDRMVDIRVFHSKGVSQPRVRTLRADVNHAPSVSFVIREGRDLISGVVRDEQGRPLERAHVTLEAMNPAAVLARLYPGLKDSPGSVRLPVPGAVRREITTTRDGRFEFAFGDHPKGTGNLMLKVAADGFRTLQREVRSGLDSMRLQLQPEVRDGAISLAADDGGPIPKEVRWVLDGEGLPAPEALRPGWYSVYVKRGEYPILSQTVYVDGWTRLAVR